MSSDAPKNVVESISEARERLRYRGTSGEGGGGDPPDNMDARIAKLEAGHEAIRAQLSEMSALLKVIDTKLDAKATEASVAGLDGKVQGVRDAIDTRASQADLNLLKGRVDALPTTMQMIIAVIGIFTAAGITRWLAH